RTGALAPCGSRVYQDGDPAAGVGALVSMLDHDRDAADVLEVRGGGVDRIAPVEGGDERREEAGEPAVVRRLVELGREIVSLEPAPALEPQLAADPLDGAVLAREADAILALARSPGEEHRDQPLGVLEVHRRGVLDLVGAVAQAAGPGAHRGGQPRDVEHLVNEMGAVVEQHAAPPRRARPARRRPAGLTARVSGKPIDRKHGEWPASDPTLAQPF